MPPLALVRDLRPSGAPAYAQIACAHGLEHGARAVAHAELREDVRDVVLDGSLGDVEGARDLAVAVAAGHQAQDLDLPVGEPVGGSSRGSRFRGFDTRADALGTIGCTGAPAATVADRADELPATRLSAGSPGRPRGSLPAPVVVVERGEDDRRRQGPPRPARGGRRARRAGHPQVEEDDVGLLSNVSDRRRAVGGLGRDFDVRSRSRRLRCPSAPASDPRRGRRGSRRARGGERPHRGDAEPPPGDFSTLFVPPWRSGFRACREAVAADERPGHGRRPAPVVAGMDPDSFLLAARSRSTGSRPPHGAPRW